MRYPPLTDWTQLTESFDFAVLGVPNDMGTQYRSGARMGPRGIREASTLYQFGHKDCCFGREVEGKGRSRSLISIVNINQPVSCHMTRSIYGIYIYIYLHDFVEISIYVHDYVDVLCWHHHGIYLLVVLLHMLYHRSRTTYKYSSFSDPGSVKNW